MKKIKGSLLLLLILYSIYITAIAYEKNIIEYILNKVEYYEKTNNITDLKKIMRVMRLIKNEEILMKMANIYQNEKYYELNINKIEKTLKKALALKQYNAAYELYKINKDNKFAFNYLKIYMDNTLNIDKQAYINMGKYYEEGIYVEKDIEKALEMYEKGMDEKESDPLLEFKIANLYFKDNISIRKSIEHYEKAEKGGLTEAAYNLGVIYFNGNEVNVDYIKSEEYFIKAYKNKNSEAAIMLGINYKDDIFETEDKYEKAFFYFNEAVNLNNLKAKYYLAEMYYKGYGTKRDIAKGEELLKELKGTEYEALAAVKLILFANKNEMKEILEDAYKSIEENQEENEDNQKIVIKLDTILDNKTKELFILTKPEIK